MATKEKSKRKIKKKKDNKVDKYVQIVLGSIVGFLLILGLIVLLILYNYVLKVNSREISHVDYQFHNDTIVIPDHSIFNDTCCFTAINFKTIIEYDKLVTELKEIMNSFEKISCEDKTYYYNEEYDYTVMEYSAKKGFLINSYTIHYNRGKTSC